MAESVQARGIGDERVSGDRRAWESNSVRQTTVDRLACPACRGRVQLAVHARDERGVQAGELTCLACGSVYGIENGVPKLFVAYNAESAPASEKFRICPSVVERWIEEELPASDRNRPAPPEHETSMDMWKWVRLGYLGVGLALWVAAIVVALTGTVTAALVLAGLGLAVFVGDYIWYRVRERRQYRHHLLLLRQVVCDTTVAPGEQKPVGQMKPVEEYVDFHLDQQRVGVQDGEGLSAQQYANQMGFVRWKAHKIAGVLPGLGVHGKRVLNIGCGGRLHQPVLKPYFDASVDMVGLDYCLEYIREFCEAFPADGVLANALCLPFADKSFDCVNCTDVIEHLFSAERLLREIARVLTDDGVLIMSTENRTTFGFFTSHPAACYAFNPLIFLERMIGTVYDRVLPPREILASWGGTAFFHNQFSPQEFRKLLRDAGLQPVTLETTFPLLKAEPLNRVLAKLPLFRHMGYTLFATVRKMPRPVSPA
jgi:SAM-dependent methyltransferase/uncharacterized protein YbaR (Trm112 family)